MKTTRNKHIRRRLPGRLVGARGTRPALPGMLPVAMLALGLTLGLGGCGKPGQDGTSYLALDAVYAPQAIYFPMLPSVVSPGTYYEHPAGSYYAEYIAWDGSGYAFTYTIEVNPGEAGGLFMDGADGPDRYYTLWLYSWGPELYYYDAMSLALAARSGAGVVADNLAAERARAAAAAAASGAPGGAPTGGTGASAGRQAGNQAASEAGTAPLPAKGSRLENRAPGGGLLGDMVDPAERKPYHYERVGPGYRLAIDGWAWPASPGAR